MIILFNTSLDLQFLFFVHLFLVHVTIKVIPSDCNHYLCKHEMSALSKSHDFMKMVYWHRLIFGVPVILISNNIYQYCIRYILIYLFESPHRGNSNGCCNVCLNRTV